MQKTEILNPDEIRAGDWIAPGKHDYKVQTRQKVMETDVIGEAYFPDEGERRLTAGVEIRQKAGTRLISYEQLAERDFRVFRPVKNLTDEEIEQIREGISE